MPCVDAWFDPVNQSFFKAANPLIKGSQAQSPNRYQHPVLQPWPTGRARADASSCLPVSPPRPVPVGPQCLCLQTRGCRPRTGHHFRVLTAVLTYRKWEIQVQTQHHEDLLFRPLLEQTVLIWVPLEVKTDFFGVSDSKGSACNAGDPGLIPGLRRFYREGNDYSLQYSCLENPTDRGA